jgi:hypothetical protein
MNIKGMDYNTQREQLPMPEYGRSIQNMVDIAVSLPTKTERQRCAESIIRIMEIMFPQMRESLDYEQKLWDHLAIMSRFQLDIDYPFEVTKEEQLKQKPGQMKYPMLRINQKHYGHLIDELFEKLKTMPDGDERDELIRLTANQMKRNLFAWNHGSMDDEKVASDLARFTDGKIQLDLDNFKFEVVKEKTMLHDNNGCQKNKRKKK